MTSASTDHTLGDYQLVELLSKGEVTLTYRANQLSVKRTVLLDALNPSFAEDDDQRNAFLADIRAKASVEHPLLATVYEASFEEDTIFFTHEELSGTTLAQIKEMGGRPFSPFVIARILQDISSAAVRLGERGIATLPLSLEDVYLPRPHEPRLTNLAISGEPSEETATQDKLTLGKALHSLMSTGESGSTRVATLTDWLGDEERAEPLRWEQVHRLSSEVVDQLAEVESNKELSEKAKKLRKTRTTTGSASGGKEFPFLLAALLLFLSASFGYFIYTKIPKRVAVNVEEVRVQTALIERAGSSDGPREVASFSMDTEEVTIAEYTAFLNALQILPSSARTVYDHSDQPPGKTGHTPEKWADMLTATTNSEKIDGRIITKDSPVTGVDWWDAYSYALWKRRGLPTVDQWLAALGDENSSRTVVPGGWAAAGSDPLDDTGAGIRGLGGNVAEWLADSFSPDDTTLATPAMTAGASFITKFGQSELQFTGRASRSNRFPDVGFRTVTISPIVP